MKEEEDSEEEKEEEEEAETDAAAVRLAESQTPTEEEEEDEIASADDSADCEQLDEEGVADGITLASLAVLATANSLELMKSVMLSPTDRMSWPMSPSGFNRSGGGPGFATSRIDGRAGSEVEAAVEGAAADEIGAESDSVLLSSADSLGTPLIRAEILERSQLIENLIKSWIL